MPITIRRSEERGYFDYDWLKTYHTFSFGQYDDPQYRNFRSLRVINEDTVKPGVGFPLHAHQDMEIFSIVLEGSLAHQDDRGNGSILYPGHIQLMSAGRGITHTEYNGSDKKFVHFLQIWVIPNVKNLNPSYQKGIFSESAKENQWCLVVSPEGQENSLNIHQDVRVFLANLDEGKQLTREIALDRFGWLHVIKGSVDVNGEKLETGDGAGISQLNHVDIKAQRASKLLFFDLN